MATINDVAKLAGVSRATVGRVIGNYGTVSPRSREKVMAAVKELNYSPNAIAQGLRSNSTKTIAVIVDNIKNTYCSTLVYAVEKEAQRDGYDVIICSSRGSVNREIQHIQNMKSRHVDGIILMSAHQIDEEISQEFKSLYEGDFPIVLVDRSVKGLGKKMILSNNVEASYEAARYLLQLGHKKIGIVATADYSTIRERIAGCRQAVEREGTGEEELFLAETVRFDQGEAQEKMSSLLDEHPEITAVYILNNSLLGGVLMEMKRRGLQVGQDLSLLTWDDEEINQLFDITTVVQPIAQIGALAFDKLHELIEGHEQMHIEQRLRAEIVYRSSCRDIKG